MRAGTRRAGLATVVASTLAMQAVVVMASLTAPVLAAVIAPEIGVAPHLVGYYSALIYGLAALTSLGAPLPVARLGVIRLHQILLALAASGLALLALGHVAAAVLSGILLGLCYGPINPASTVLLARFAPPSARARVFSLKQTAVPVGGALAGSVTPMLALWFGWRGAALVIAGACLLLALVVQRWRAELDDDRTAATGGTVRAALVRPIHVMTASSALREIGVASFAFGAVQFSFSSMFPTVLGSLGWDVVAAGSVLSMALALSIGSRLFWGWVADRVAPRRVLAALGLMMTAAAVATGAVQPSWPPGIIVAAAAVFGVSASTWNGIAIADVVRRVTPDNISPASAGTIALTFGGALFGPLLFSLAVSASGSFAPAFLLLAAATCASSVLLLRAR